MKTSEKQKLKRALSSYFKEIHKIYTAGIHNCRKQRNIEVGN